MYFQDGVVAIVLVVIADVVGAMFAATDIGLGETIVLSKHLLTACLAIAEHIY